MNCRFAALSSLILLAGCAGAIDAPSLAVRPSEAAAAIDAAQPALAVAPITPAAIVPLDAATLARLQSSISAAQASVAPFAKAAEPARVAVANAAGAAIGSDAWIAAQVAVSRLERTRDAATAALAEVDLVRRELVVSGKNFDRDGFAAMQASVAKIDSDQQAQTTALLRRLKSR